MRPTPLWLWPNLLSLDAPLVALVWQDFAAHSFGHPLRLPARIVLALTVWAIYVVDRLLDEESATLGELEAQVGRPIRLQVEALYGIDQYDVVLV